MMTTLVILAAMTGQQPAKPSALAPEPTPKPAARPAPAAPARPYVSLADKRRMKKDAAYRARLRREAAEAQAQARAMAEAKREFERQLPYLVQMRGQTLDRISAAERNAIWNQYLNGGGAQGVTRGAAPAPPRIVNLPGQPYAP
jgi:hypothetical protein